MLPSARVSVRYACKRPNSSSALRRILQASDISISAGPSMQSVVQNAMKVSEPPIGTPAVHSVEGLEVLHNTTWVPTLRNFLLGSARTFAMTTMNEHSCKASTPKHYMQVF